MCWGPRNYAISRDSGERFRPLPHPDGATAARQVGVVPEGVVMLALGEDAYLWSLDSEAWEVLPRPGLRPTHRLYDDGVFVAVERRADSLAVEVAELPDMRWRRGTLPLTGEESPRGLRTDGDDLWLWTSEPPAFGGRLLRSTDRGRTWRASSLALGGGEAVVELFRFRGALVALSNTAEGYLLRRLEGEAWVEVERIPNVEVASVAVGRDRLVIVTELDGWRAWAPQD